MDVSQFLKRLGGKKTAVELRLGIARYPYQTLDNLKLVDELFAQAGMDLKETISSGRILDLGCGDGDLGFYLSAQGHAVDLVDFEETNQNKMEMVRALCEELEGEHRARNVDVERGLLGLETSYSFAYVLGLLYHLKNPFLVMNDLATMTNYAVVSTRVLAGAVLPDALASAYLVNDYELGQDNTNFWLFNSAGFARLAERSGWTVIGRLRFGDVVVGDLERHDAREVLLLASQFSVFGKVRMTYGLNRMEYGSYRWTAQAFGVEARVGEQEETLCLRYFLPPGMVEGHRLRVMERGTELPVEKTVGKNECLLRVKLGGRVGRVALDVVCEHAGGAAAQDERDLGVVVRIEKTRPPVWVE